MKKFGGMYCAPMNETIHSNHETIHGSKAENKDASFIFLTKLVILLKCTGHGRAHQNQRYISMVFDLKIINQASHWTKK